jgi:hypothetical protein
MKTAVVVRRPMPPLALVREPAANAARRVSDIADLRLMTSWARKLLEGNQRVPTASLGRLLDLSDRVASHAEERRR